MKKIFAAICFLVLFLPQTVSAQSCDNRYVTFVNPVRGRDLWLDRSLKPLQDQYNALNEYHFPATWLLQYDALKDRQILSQLKQFDGSQEFGVFLEISSNLATQARVIYPYNAAWFSPQAVFLSGYSESERIKLIDKLFADFKGEFGYFPKSVGAWWVDSYSLNYMREKYGVVTAMIVADQKTTDNYGVWGQWWGMPYYPDKANILTPASSLKNKQNVAIIQWAQRDPILGYGSGHSSLYSLQANDYKQVGKDTDYFKEISSVYLDCQNPLGQITVGLETGMESIDFLGEYKNQLTALNGMDVKAVTMSEFAGKFTQVYPDFPTSNKLRYKNTEWILSPQSRDNIQLSDKINYYPDAAFKDYFLPDKTGFLNRQLDKFTSKSSKPYVPWFFAVILVVGILAVLKRQMKSFFLGTIFGLAAFGLLLRSSNQFGWQVFYGPVFSPLAFWQAVVMACSYLSVWLLLKTKLQRLLIWSIPLSFSLDVAIQYFRYSFISGKYYLGVSTDALHFLGISFEKPANLHFVNQDFPSFLAAGLWRFDFSKYWTNPSLSLVVYPLTHVLLGLALGWLLLKVPSKARGVILVLLTLLLLVHICDIFQADPRLVQ